VKVVILNQYYAPDVASTGHLLHELANDLALHGNKVQVITCRPSYGPPESWQPCPKRERTAEGVRVFRMRSTRFSKDRIVGRLINSVTFLVPLFLRVLFRKRRGEVFLYTTNPPYLGIVGTVASFFRPHPYVLLLHDAYPQLAVWVGKIRKSGIIDRFWHFINGIMYRRARQTIVLCDAAKELVCNTYGVDPGLVHVIPNWADGEFLTPIEKKSSPFAVRNDLVEPFTVLYSGNLGLYYEFDTILNAATILRNDNFKLVFIGAGGVRGHIEQQIKERQLDNTLLLPHQPFDTLNESLNACDASLVTIAKGIEGISFPSKLYSSLAVGKPILAISERYSSLKSIIEHNDAGRWIELGDPDGLVKAIRNMMQDPHGTSRMGKAARDLFNRDYTLQSSASKYSTVLSKASPES
jgi:glycosyltransferase involved in cell wall biosynthesis